MSPNLQSIETEKIQPPGAFTVPSSPINPDPLISLRPSSSADNALEARKNAVLARGQVNKGSANPVTFYTENESAPGSNDTVETAERLRKLDTGKSGRNTAIVYGSLGDLLIRDLAQAEDDGSIPLALESGVTSSPDGIRFTGVIGDGPMAGTVSDFDFVKVSVPANTTFDINVRTEFPFADLDPFVSFWLEDGTLIFTQDDGGNGWDTFVTLTVGPSDLTFYMAIGGFGAFFPADPFNSTGGSVTGEIGSEGAYEFEMRVFPPVTDSDAYSLHLNKGDVLGVAARISGAPSLRIYGTDGAAEKSVTGFGSFADPNSPLPVNGSGVIDYVVEETGVHTVELSGGFGDYELEIAAFQPALEADPKRVQLVWLDYNGGPVSKEPWFGFPFISDHTPFRDFLNVWGLPDSDDDVRRITAAITEEVRDNLEQEIESSGENRKFDVVVLGNNGTGEMDWLEPYIDQGTFEMFGITYEVSVVEISGTRNEAFINTIGIASTIDPGNFSLNDTALMLLDVLSAPASGANANFTFSLNDVVLAPGASKEELVVTVIGNVTAHEAGHYLGNFHTDGVFTLTHSIMDEGPGGLFNLAGIGASGIFGAEDQVDVAFIDDDYSVLEGFEGRENTTTNTAFGLHYGPSNGENGAPSPR